jgi:hypothetical protein
MMAHGVPVDYEPAFVEEAVFRCVTAGGRTAAYHVAREAAYAAADDEREAAFQRLHSQWFTRLDLGEPLRRALDELPLLADHVERCVVRWARAPGDEGADLLVSPAAAHDAPAGRRRRDVIVVGLRPERVGDRPALLYFLRHELLHVADMLDPSFGYESALPHAEGGPTHVRLLMERYRALWAATIDARLVRRGHAPDGTRERRLRDLSRTFGLPEPAASRLLCRFFDRQPHTHADLVAAACDPGRAVGSPGTVRCPVCGFSTTTTRRGAAIVLPPAVSARVRADFPRWRPEDGLCTQCAELYRSRDLSDAALRALPRA